MIFVLSFHLIAEINFVDVRVVNVGTIFYRWSLIGRSILDILHIYCKNYIEVEQMKLKIIWATVAISSAVI